MITRTTVVARTDRLMATALQDQTVLLDVPKASYYGLDEVSTRIWSLLEQPRTVGDLCAELETEYDVTPSDCETEVLKVLEVMVDNDMVYALP